MQRSLDRGGYVYVYPYITRARIIFPFYGAKLFRELDFREIVVNDEHDRFACFSFEDHDFADDRRCIYSNFTDFQDARPRRDPKQTNAPNFRISVTVVKFFFLRFFP